MFTWLNKQGVQSDRGFVVQSMNRYIIEYRESTSKVRVEVDRGFLNGMSCVSISPMAFQRWEGDPNGTTIPPEKQKEMLANFREAMEFQGVAVVVE